MINVNKTVLIVERDPAEAEKILAFFQGHKFRNPIDVVSSKSEALEYIFRTGKYESRKNHEVPGLILLDLLTNKTQDLYILEPLQHYLRTQSIPLLILTSSEEQEKEAGEYHLGAVCFVRKPLDLTHFIEAMQMIGLKWKEIQKAVHG
jgi:two-component system response regulator